MRASAAVERCGVPSVSLVCDGFIGQGSIVARGLGIGELPIARIPGHVDGQSDEELAAGIGGVTFADVVRHLTTPVSAAAAGEQPKSGDIVAEGGFDDVNAVFEERRWSDGLPIVPPTP